MDKECAPFEAFNDNWVTGVDSPFKGASLPVLTLDEHLSIGIEVAAGVPDCPYHSTLSGDRLPALD